MWYLYLNRDQQYLRSYRTHNLWLDPYAAKMRAPKIHAFHIAAMKRLAKSTSGVSRHPRPSPALPLSAASALHSSMEAAERRFKDLANSSN